MPSTNIFATQNNDDEVVVGDADEDEDEEPQLAARGRGRIPQRTEQ
nr:hypothetical protein [Lupinus angustifolius]